jgi:outer membrane protein TolC
LKNIPPSTDAVLVGQLLRVSDEDFQTLVEELIKRQLPSFSVWGREEVEEGILASVTPANIVHYIARTVAVDVHDILRGENAGTLPAGFLFSEQFTINMATARAIDIYPSLSILTEADLLNEERKDISRVLTLESAVQEALVANLDLAAADRIVLAGAQSVIEARSALLPQIGIGSSAEIIDKDRAEFARGQNPERAWRGFADANMLIYSDKFWSNYTVQKHFQDSLMEEREALRLDIIQTAATAYLNILRAKTIERIQKDNLKLTRANLERARIRQTIGVAGPDEVYRWESEIAKDRQTVLESESVTMNAMNDLNRILNRPLQEPFIAQEAELSDPLLSVSDKLFSTLVNQPKGFGTFRAFMVQEGLEASPELRRFDADIAAKDRERVSAKRAFWLPDFSLEAIVSERFAASGAGSDPPAGVDSPNSTDWTVGVFATLPLFTSGQKKATLKRTQEELDGLKIERDATTERIEERIRNAINITRSSYPSIQLSRDAADAADKNLELITNSYTKGIKSIIDLLDAQNTALVADERAANANYNFLVDLMNVQRAVGRFDFFLSEEDRRAWLHRFEIFSREAGVELREH